MTLLCLTRTQTRMNSVDNAACAQDVNLSIYQSVTRRYYVETVKCIIKIFRYLV